MNGSDAEGRALVDADAHVSFRHELLRKGIHLSSLSIPVIYYFISRDLALALLIPVTALFLIGDLLRCFHRPSFELYQKIFGPMLRQHEKMPDRLTLNGATWVLISATICVLAFPKLITITAFSILIISDTTAALIGLRFGTKKYRDKTLEGSSAFVISAALVVLCTPKVAGLPGEYFIGIAAGILGAIAEVFSFNIVDDNLAIPIAIGICLWIMYAVFFPGLDVRLLD